jgi:hypothetical protein
MLDEVVHNCQAILNDFWWKLWAHKPHCELHDILRIEDELLILAEHLQVPKTEVPHPFKLLRAILSVDAAALLQLPIHPFDDPAVYIVLHEYVTVVDILHSDVAQQV